MQSAASNAHSAPPAAPPSFRIITTPLPCWRTTHHEHTNLPDRSFHQFLNTQYPFTQHWEFSYLFRKFLVNYIIKKQRIIVTPPKRHCHWCASTLKAGGCDFVVGKYVLGWMRSRERVRGCGERNKVTERRASVTATRPGLSRKLGTGGRWQSGHTRRRSLDRRCSLRCSGTISDTGLANF